MTARRIMVAVGTTALLASGVYVFVYLYRWEWHRALLAGIIFIAAEVGVGVMMVLDRLRRIERQLEGAATADDLDRVLRHVQEAAPPARAPFPWLAGEADRLSVFVPILLGAGVMLSAVAWGVERLARATAGPVLERGLALRLMPLAFPEGSLTGAPVTTPSMGANTQSWRRGARAVGVTLLLGVVTAAAVDGLADLTQDRPDGAPAAGAVSVITLEVSSKAHYNDGGTLAVANTVWHSCTSQLRRHKVPRMVDLGGGHVEAQVSPALGPNALARLRGCLDDATVDRLQINVAAVRTATR
jgi:hypothetical protein